MPRQVATSGSRRSAWRKGDAGPSQAAAVRDRMLQHIDAAAVRLRPRRRITDEDVHEARKSIKRARAALRLLQPALAANEMARSRVSLRDAGRALASVRDAKVMADRFSEMLRRTGIDEFAVSTIASAASSSNSPAARRSARTRSNPAAARAGLTNARRWLSDATLTADGWLPLAEGIRAIYKSGRRDLPTDASAASSEALHEWRKRVKNYWHALEVLVEPKRPAYVRQTINSARRLADALGEEHDLALLAEALRASQQSEDERVTILLEAIRLRRRRLRRRALRTGSKLYAETPGAMVRQLRPRLPPRGRA